MAYDFGSPYNGYHKWRKRVYEQTHGEGSWDKGAREDKPTAHGFQEFRDPYRTYWSEKHSVGILERDDKYLGIACLVAKEVTDRESFVKKFGLSFGGDVHWKAAPVLLDHLSRSPMFKAVLVTINKVPFKLEPDVPEELEGRLNWAKRNYEFHKDKADSIKGQIESTSGTFGGPFPNYAPKQMKEEQDYARKFLDTAKSVEAQMRDHIKPYFLIKENLFAAALFFYVYTHPYKTVEQALNEILARRRAAKIEANLTYFVRCSDVTDPLVALRPEFFPSSDDMRKYYCLVLAQDCAGFNCDKDVASVLRKMFTTALEIPKEIEIEENIHIPTEEVSVERPKSALLGYVVKSVIKKRTTKRRVYFPLDVLTGHAIVFGKTRTGKSFFSLILIQEALANGVKAVVFDPHGTISNRLRPHELLKAVYTRGKKDITNELEEIYTEASAWEETNELRLLVVLDETRLLRAKNLTGCLNELGKRGVGFVLITQYSTSIPAEARNVGTYFIMAAMSDTEVERFREVTLHPSSKLITRMPRATSFVFSPYWYPEPFFVRHRKI